MTTRNLGALESVDVRQIWPHEERNFTVWLSENLGELEPALKFQLELVRREDSSGPGRVDILAREVKSGRLVVIENQLEWSDDGHFARLMGYTASRGAGILVWITTGFHQWHRDILDWLNKAGVEVFGLEVRAYRIGEIYGYHFEKIVGPDDEGNFAEIGPARGASVFGRFYPELTGKLRGEGIPAMGGRNGGWTGSYRRFRSGLEHIGVAYSTHLGRGADLCWATLHIVGDYRQAIYDGLAAYREELEAEFGGSNLLWINSESAREYWVWVETDGLAWEDEQNELRLAEKRAWMFENLVALRNAVQPRLEKVVEGLGLGIQ